MISRRKIMNLRQHETLQLPPQAFKEMLHYRVGRQRLYTFPWFIFNYYKLNWNYLLENNYRVFGLNVTQKLKPKQVYKLSWTPEYLENLSEKQKNLKTNFAMPDYNVKM